MTTIEWAGPPLYLPPPDPAIRPDGTRHYSGVTYAAPIGYRPLQLELWVPKTDGLAPLVVWIHGGGWFFGDRRTIPETLRPNQLFDELLASGIAVASIDYRLTLEAPFPAQLHDAKAAVRYLRAYADTVGISTERVGVWGESAGGHLAALVGLTGVPGADVGLEGDLGVVGPSSAVDAVVDWYGPAELGSLMGRELPPVLADRLPPSLRMSFEAHLVRGADEAVRAAANPLAHVTPDAPPFLLVHGTEDQVVPYAQSELMATALQDVGVSARLVPVEGADHIFDGCADIDAVVRLSVDYLAEALLSPAQRKASP